jgi:hypothetical protein
VYKRYSGISLDGILNLINVHSSFIEEMMEDVVSLEGFLSGLLVAKDKIDPLMKVRRDVITLQSLKVGSTRIQIVLVIKHAPYM